jgi:uncharacterized protein YecT (DUF1311 family)
MKLSVAVIGACALVILSACSREPAPAEKTSAATAQTQSVAQDELTAPAAEETSEASTPPEPCDDAPDQRAMTACWANASRTEEEHVDAALKKLDALLVAKSSPAAHQKLQDDQGRWQQFVEGHCGMYAELYDGGSAGPMTVAVCRWQLAQDRIQQLSALTEELDR